MVTQNDIALVAGVNKSTVSKALRGSSDISKDTSKRILEIAEQLGYSHKSVRKTMPNKIIGIMCPEVVSEYYARMNNANRTFDEARIFRINRIK